MHINESMIRLEDAFQIVDRALSDGAVPRETIPVRRAIGRVLAADQVSRLELPPFDKSAMDGYAVLAGDAGPRFRVLETIAAGELPKATLTPGTAIKVMTGAPVPAGTGLVVKLENVAIHGDEIEVLRQQKAANICIQGEDVRPGDVLLRAGTRLAAIDVANLVGGGITEIEVFRPVQVAVFSTGEEIADDPDSLRPGLIMNTNKPLMAGLARQFGLEVVREESLPDDRRRIAAAVGEALVESDLIVLSGGVSAGDFDFVGPALEDAGLWVHFSRIALKPGKPVTFASGEGKAALGLPGNPAAVFLTFHLFVLRAAARLMGIEPPLRETQLPLAEEYRRRKADRRQYVPARLGDDGTLIRVEFHGSAHLTALGQADGFFAVPIGCETLPAGHVVRFLPIIPGWR